MMLPLAKIVTDVGTQARAALDDHIVEEYADLMKAGTVFPPVVVFHDESAYYMADGFQRAAARRLAGFEDIKVEVKRGGKQDALWYALGANRLHGTRLNVADKRHAILLALQTWPERSQTQIAEQIGCALSYVVRIRSEVSTSEDLPARVVGKDGKSYPATRPAIRAQPDSVPAERPNGNGGAKARTSDSSESSGVETRRAVGAAGVSDAVLKNLPRRKILDLVANAVNGLRGLTEALPSIAAGGLAQDKRLSEWIDSLESTVMRLRRFLQQLREERNGQITHRS